MLILHSSRYYQTNQASAKPSGCHQRLMVSYFASLRKKNYTMIFWRTRNHRSRFLVEMRSSVNTHKFSFFPRTISDWNQWPSDIGNSPSLNAFLARFTESAGLHFLISCLSCLELLGLTKSTPLTNLQETQQHQSINKKYCHREEHYAWSRIRGGR